MSDLTDGVSLERLAQFIAESTHQIGVVRKEVEEIQIGFNSAYVEWKADHDAALERLVEDVVARLDDVGRDLRERIEDRLAEERRIIDERRQELREKLIPETRENADEALGEGGRLLMRLRQENPRLDQQEEKLKAKRAALEQELTQLNEQIRRLSGCVGVVVNFFKISRLDRQRQRVIGQLHALRVDLRDVRQEWQEMREKTQTGQDTLQHKWREEALRLAQLRAEASYLDDPGNREDLAFRRATRHVLDDLKESIPCPADDIAARLDEMVRLNVQTDDYHEGLGTVGGLLALLDGIGEGMKRFGASVDGLIREQRMHSAHLPRLRVAVPGNVVKFHEQWGDLAQKMHDEGRICANPGEFLAVLRPVLEEDLSESSINTAFEDLGQALTVATSHWR